MGIPILPPSTLNYITPGVSPYIGREGEGKIVGAMDVPSDKPGGDE